MRSARSRRPSAKRASGPAKVRPATVTPREQGRSQGPRSGRRRGARGAGIAGVMGRDAAREGARGLLFRMRRYR
jgi:hypothetical protein